MARKLKLDVRPGEPITAVPLSWFQEVTRAVNALYSLQGAGGVVVAIPDVPSDKDPIVIDGHTSLQSPNVT